MGDPTRALRVTWLATKLAGTFSRRLAGSFASRLWFTPWPVPIGERAAAKQARWLRSTEAVSFEVGGRRLAGFAAGEGPTVLLVHGWGERAATLGAAIEPLVAAGYRVVGVDLPGHGSASLGRTHIFELADAIRAVALQLGGVDAIVAHSMGGYNTMVALTRGLELRAAVLMAPASDVGHVMEKFQAAFSLPDRAMDGLRADIERRFGGDVWDRLDVRRHARNFALPALIVHDRDDPQIDASVSVELAAAWPGARIHLTSGLGHDRATRDPAVLDNVVGFLRTHVPAGAVRVRVEEPV